MSNKRFFYYRTFFIRSIVLLSIATWSKTRVWQIIRFTGGIIMNQLFNRKWCANLHWIDWPSIPRQYYNSCQCTLEELVSETREYKCLYIHILFIYLTSSFFYIFLPVFFIFIRLFYFARNFLFQNNTFHNEVKKLYTYSVRNILHYTRKNDSIG